MCSDSAAGVQQCNKPKNTNTCAHKLTLVVLVRQWQSPNGATFKVFGALGDWTVSGCFSVVALIDQMFSSRWGNTGQEKWISNICCFVRFSEKLRQHVKSFSTWLKLNEIVQDALEVQTVSVVELKQKKTKHGLWERKIPLKNLPWLWTLLTDKLSLLHAIWITLPLFMFFPLPLRSAYFLIEMLLASFSLPWIHKKDKS